MSVAKIMYDKLDEAFSPLCLEVIDNSDQHIGHAGARPEGETHFLIKITAAAFSGKTRLACHRMINQVLKDDLEGPVHALAISVSAPQDEQS